MVAHVNILIHEWVSMAACLPATEPGKSGRSWAEVQGGCGRHAHAPDREGQWQLERARHGEAHRRHDGELQRRAQRHQLGPARHLCKVLRSAHMQGHILNSPQVGDWGEQGGPLTPRMHLSAHAWRLSARCRCGGHLHCEGSAHGEHRERQPTGGVVLAEPGQAGRVQHRGGGAQDEP